MSKNELKKLIFGVFKDFVSEKMVLKKGHFSENDSFLG